MSEVEELYVPASGMKIHFNDKFSRGLRGRLTFESNDRLLHVLPSTFHISTSDLNNFASKRACSNFIVSNK